jgi:hypothetical protein
MNLFKDDSKTARIKAYVLIVHGTSFLSKKHF